MPQETPDEMDLRRAKAMAFEHWGLAYSHLIETGIEFIWSTKLTPAEREKWLRHARVVRASDEALGAASPSLVGLRKWAA